MSKVPKKIVLWIDVDGQAATEMEFDDDTPVTYVPEAELQRVKAERDRYRYALEFYAGAELSDFDMDIFDRVRVNAKNPKHVYVEFVDTEWLCGPARKALAPEASEPAKKEDV